MTFRLTVPRKVLLLLLLPLVFIVGFVTLIAQLRRAGEERAIAIARSKDIIAQTQIVLRGLTDASTAMTGYALTHDPALSREFTHAEREIEPAFGRLLGMLDDPAQVTATRALEASTQELLRKLIDLQGLDALHPSAEVDAVGPTLHAATALLNDIRRSGAELLDAEQRLDADRDKALQHEWDRIDNTLVTGAAIAGVLTILLGVLLGRSISRRVTILAQNARHFADGEPLLQRIGGRDEIGALDAAFHDMAQELGRAMARERAIMENAADVIGSFDIEGRFLVVSSAAARVFGYTSDELVGRSWIELMVPLDEVEPTRAALQKLRADGGSTTFETRCRRSDGFFINVMWSATWSPAEQLVYGVARDVTERLAAHKERQFYLETIDRLEEAVFELDNLCIVRHMSHAWVALNGRDHGIIGVPLASQAHPEDREQLESVLKSVVEGEQPLARLRFRLLRPGGGEVWVDSQLLPYRDVYGTITGVRGVLRDVTEAYVHEQRIAQLALYDPLTQLPNRACFEDRLNVALARSRRSGLKVAVGFVDVDNFKQINDRLGHAAGDRVLQALAKSLSRELRRGDTLSRWGGDEFVVLLPDLAATAEAGQIAARLLEAAGSASDEMSVTLSIGIALFPDHADGGEALMVQADRAMFRAKHSGRNNVQLIQAGIGNHASAV